jgi:hypothetical protein
LQSSHSRQIPLNSIEEEDESLADTLVSDFGTTKLPEHDHTVRLIGKAQFIDALAGSNDDEGSDESSDMEASVEEVDVEISSSSGHGSSEDEDESLSLTKPVARRFYSHSHTMKSAKTQSRGSTKPHTKHEPNREKTYDPSTCREWPANLKLRM